MKKNFRTVLWCLFAAYCLALIWVLFLNRPVGVSMSIPEYFRTTANIVPLRTIIRYVTIYGYGYVKLATANLLGNFLLFFPMGATLPILCKPLDKLWRIALVLLGMIVAVELMQGILRVGTPDIDDVIFNLAGAVLAYGITKIPLINNAIKKISA